MSAQIIAQLKALSLHGMAASFPEVAAQARHTEFNPETFMHQLVAAESAQPELAFQTLQRQSKNRRRACKPGQTGRKDQTANNKRQRTNTSLKTEDLSTAELLGFKLQWVGSILDGKTGSSLDGNQQTEITKPGAIQTRIVSDRSWL